MTERNVAADLARQNLDLTTIVGNILAVWEASPEATRESGARWYLNAQREIEHMAMLSGHAPEQVAAVVAHLSPRTPWDRNLEGARAVCGLVSRVTRNPETGRWIGLMPANVDRAETALNSDNPLATVKGPKTSAFAANLLGDQDRVTVDVWALRVALGHDIPTADLEKIIGRAGIYSAIEHAYRIAAHQAGITPSTMQATTWITARNGRTN